MYTAKHQLPLPKASLVAQVVKKVKVKVTQSSVRLFEDRSPWNSLGQNTGVGNLSLLQGIFPTQRSNSDLPHCRQILYQLSHKGRPRILKWVAYPFSSRSSQPNYQSWRTCLMFSRGLYLRFSLMKLRIPWTVCLLPLKARSPNPSKLLPTSFI